MGGNYPALVFGQFQVELTAGSEGVPQTQEEGQWLGGHAMLLCTREQVEAIILAHVFTSLRDAYLHALTARLFNLAPGGRAQARPGNLGIRGQGNQPARVQISGSQVVAD